MTKHRQHKLAIDPVCLKSIDPSLMQYIEQIANQKGIDAIYLWLYFKNTKEKWMPRYCKHRDTGEIVAQKNDSGSLPAGYNHCKDPEAFNHLLNVLRNRRFVC